MPKWPNPSYTNIMIATHADSVVAEAINKGFHGFDYQLAYDAAYKDAMRPPEGDTTRDWHDRQPGVPYEARPGLKYYKQLGYVPVDKTAEAAAETLEDAYDDFAVAQVAKALGRDEDFRLFIGRSRNYRNLYFFFQAEDGIRDYKVTGVQTCALPILSRADVSRSDTISVSLKSTHFSLKPIGIAFESNWNRLESNWNRPDSNSLCLEVNSDRKSVV